MKYVIQLTAIIFSFIFSKVAVFDSITHFVNGNTSSISTLNLAFFTNFRTCGYFDEFELQSFNYFSMFFGLLSIRLVDS